MDHFVGLAFKGLTLDPTGFYIYQIVSLPEC